MGRIARKCQATVSKYQRRFRARECPQAEATAAKQTQHHHCPLSQRRIATECRRRCAKTCAAAMHEIALNELQGTTHCQRQQQEQQEQRPGGNTLEKRMGYYVAAEPKQ